MRNLLKVNMLAVASLAAVMSCTKEPEAPAGDQLQELHFIVKTAENAPVKSFIENEQDGTYTPKWSNGDELALFVGDITSSTSAPTATLSNTTADGPTASFDGTVPTSLTEGSFLSFSPAGAFAKGYTDGTVGINLSEIQNPSNLTIDEACDVLVAKPCDYLAENGTVNIENLYFKRIFSVVKVNLKGVEALNGEKVTSFTFNAPVTLTGRAAVDLSTASISKWNVDNKSVTAKYSEDYPAFGGTDGLDNSVWLVVNPSTVASESTITFSGETENYTFSKEVTLTKDLVFPQGQIAVINLTIGEGNYAGKAPVTQLVPDGEYVIAYGKNIMTVGTASNKYRGVATLPETANTDGSYSVAEEAAWELKWNSESDTYSIKSVSENSYLNWTSSTSLTLNSSTPTNYSITKKEDGTYNIGSTSGTNTRYIGYNVQDPRFAMYLSDQTSQPIDLKLYTAKVAKAAEITVQGTLALKADSADGNISVSWKNVDLSSTAVAVYQDESCTIKEESWISVVINDDKTAIHYAVLNNDTESERKAYIKVEAASEDGESKVSKVIVVTQAKAESETMVTYPYTESFAESQGDFTIEDLTMPSPLTYVWNYTTYSGGNYMKASAYVSGTNYATESWLISPVVDMSSAENPVLSFMNVARYGSNENLTLWAREKGGDWTQLSFSNYGSGSDWTFVNNTVDVSAYTGKTLQFAFKYVSTSSGASTWEIKNVEVKEYVAPTLTSIAWTGYTTTYTVGDTFKADGTVTAYYSDGSSSDVEATFSTPDMSSEGTKTVTVTYEDKTTTGEIIVKAASTGGEELNTYISTFIDKNLSTNEANGIAWTASIDANSFESASPSRGVQFGSAKGKFTITGKGVSGSIKKITMIVSTNGTANANTIDVTIGGTTIGSQVALGKSNNYEISFESGTALVGDIVISVNDSNKSVYFKSITINPTN
ncbi:MAG: choice-of-anchor J domain-containing protein [Candidatus Cryptobacteroides sp.]